MLESSTTLIFQKPLDVQMVTTAYDSTFVVLCKDEGPSSQPYKKILHMRADGFLIHFYVFSENIESIVMLDHSTLAFYLGKRQQFVIIDLRKKILKHVPFELQFALGNQNSRYALRRFQNSNWIILIQRQTHNVIQSRQRGVRTIASQVAIQLKYFDQSDLSKIVHEYKNISPYESTQRQTIISISNSESQIAIKQLVNDARCEIILHDLVKTQTGVQSKTRLIVFNIRQSIRSFHLSVRIWEYEYNHFRYIFAKQQKNIMCTRMIKEQFEKFNILTHQGQTELPIQGNNQIIFMKNCACVKKGKDQFGKSRILWIDMESGRIENELELNQIMSWDISVSQCDPSMMVVMGKHRDKRQLLVRSISQFRVKQFYMQLLLHIDQDFDDDLLMDIIELLEKEQT